MRYEARWSNGSWKLFDTFNYRAIRGFSRRIDAENEAKGRNQ